MRTTTCILLLAAAAWGQQVAVPQGGSLGPSSRLSDAATMSADEVDGSHSSSTPGASTVPVSGSNGKLAPGWIPLPTSSSIGGLFMDADCLTGNHVSGIDAASGRLECSADAADWSTIANKPAAFPPDISSQAWQDLLAALALKAPQAALDAKLAISALDSTLIVSKFNGGACAGYLKSDGSCDTPSGSEGTPSLDETSVSGSVYSSKPFKVAGTQTDMEVVEGTPVEVAGENHWSVDSTTHRPVYSYNGGVANKVAFVGDAVAAEDVSGLGDAATRNVGTAAGTVAAGDDSRITGAAPLNSPTFTGTVGGITKSMVGLGNVDNTSDANKPVSTATQAALDAKLASSALNSTLIVSKFGSGSCSGYLKNDGTCSTPSGSESTPSLSEDSTTVNSTKPVAVTGTQTDFKVTEGATTAATSENHFFFDSATHRPAYSYNGGTSKLFAYMGDAVSSTQLPTPTASTPGGVNAKTCSGTDKLSAIGTDGVPVCSADLSGGYTGWFTAPVTTHTPDTETFSGSVDVTIGGCAGGTAYYTTDGGSTITAYASPVHLTATTTLVSRCEKAHYEVSAVKSSIYTVPPGSSYSDDFTGVAGTSPPNANWTDDIGATQNYAGVRDGPKTAGTGGVILSHYNAASFNADQYSRARIYSINSTYQAGGPAIRVTASGGYVALAHNTSELTLYKVTAAAPYFTILCSTGQGQTPGPATVAANDVIEISAVGTTITVKRTSPNPATLITCTDSSFASGSAGVAFWDVSASARLDDWSGGNQ